MRQINRKGTITESDLINNILKDINGCDKFKIVELSPQAEIKIKKPFKDDVLYITYKIDLQLLNNLKRKLKNDTKQ